MKNNQLLNLFLSNFVIFFTGIGLFPLLPLYATDFGATPTIVGFYLAFTYISITVGTMITSWLTERIPHKKLYIGAGILGVPAIILLGQATTLWQVVLLTALIWFSGGIGLALSSVFTGLFADGNSRGNSFSLMWMAFPLAALISGVVVGQLVEWQGYPMMFIVLATLWAGWPLVGAFRLDLTQVASKLTAPKAVQKKASLGFGQIFYVILLVALLSEMAIYISRMSISLSMQSLNFSLGAVSSTATIGGLVTIPIALLVGKLTDRFGRKNFIVVGLLMVAGGTLVLTSSVQLWHFWLATVLLFGGMYVNGSVVPAFVTDLLAPEVLSRGLPWVNTMGFIAGTVGFASAGYLIDTLGATNLYLITAALPIIALGLLGLTIYKPQPVVKAQHDWGNYQFNRGCA